MKPAISTGGRAEPSDAAPLRRGRGRRPAAPVRRAVLTAAGEILFDRGVKEVTFEKVALRAGVSKQTLYKWWPSPGALAFESYRAAVEETLAFANTGDIIQDLTHQLRSFIQLLTEAGGGPVISELIGVAQTDPALALAFSQHYVQPRRHLAVDRLRKAQDSGQIRPDVDCEVVVDQLWGACYHRLLLPAQPLSADFADALVSNLMVGVHSRASGS